MSSKFELLYNQLSEDQINQIIQGLRGEQPMNNGIEVDEQLVNNEKMASYSQVVSGTTVKIKIKIQMIQMNTIINSQNKAIPNLIIEKVKM